MADYKYFIDSIKSPEQLMHWMNNNITYDLPDEDYDDASTFMTKTGEELWKTKTGHCAEQSYFEKDVLENLGYKCYLIFCKEENDAQDYGSDGSAHVFLIAEKGGKYYYFEHAMEHSRGIHEFSSIKDCIAFVAKNWWRYEDTSTKLVFRKMNAPITGINNADLAKECYKLPVIAITNISKNRMEEDLKTSTQFKYIINPQDNLELAKKLEPIIDNFTLPKYCTMRRDNCMIINLNVQDELKKHSFDPEITGGYFIVDNVNLVDAKDLKTLNSYNDWRNSGLSKPEYIKSKNYLSKDLGWYTYVPHYWLELDGLIIDRAWPMFSRALEKPITKERYTRKDFNEDLKDDAKAHFGTTTRWKSCFYINTDGTMLDGSGAKFGARGSNMRTLDHRDIADIIPEGAEGTEAMLAYMAEGNIRFQPEARGFEIMKKPTYEQYETLEKMITDFDDEVNIDIVAENGDVKESFFHDWDEPASKILAQVKRYFVNNEALVEEFVDNNRIIYTTQSPYEIKDRLNNAPRYGLRLAYDKVLDRYFVADASASESIHVLMIAKASEMGYYENKMNAVQATRYCVKNVICYRATTVDFPSTLGEEGFMDCYEYDNFKLYIRDYTNYGGAAVDFKQTELYTVLGKYKEHRHSSHEWDQKGSIVEQLNEDTRTQLISKSRNADLYKNNVRGKNRFERKKYSKLATQVKNYNNIDMNDFFKKDLLTVNIPVTGETNSYDVTFQFDGVVAEIARNIKSNQNKFEYRTVIQALTKVFNSANVKVKCSCNDFKFRFQHALILSNDNVDGTDKDPGPGKTGMANTQGKGCKHVLLALANLDWVMKVASCIKNYITYMDENKHQLFIKVIFPKLYGITADDAAEKNLIPDDVNIETDKNTIETINNWAKQRGKFKAGTNVNPVKGKGSIDLEKTKKETEENK